MSGQKAMGTLLDVQRSWNAFGQDDPMWAILTERGKEHHGWNVGDFFATGVTDVEKHLAVLGQHTSLAAGTALDFGCGIGRLTHALADHYSYVLGVDLAPSMVLKATELNNRPERMEFRLNDPPDLSWLPNERFDLIFSLLTLQHVEPRYQLGYLTRFLELVKPGGAIVVQMMADPLIPVPAPSGEAPVMEMHGVAPSAVVRRIRGTQAARILDIRYDAGQSEWSPAWVSFVYYILKTGHWT